MLFYCFWSSLRIARRWAGVLVEGREFWFVQFTLSFGRHCVCFGAVGRAFWLSNIHPLWVIRKAGDDDDDV